MVSRNTTLVFQGSEKMPRLSYFFTNNINKLRGAQSAISPGPPQLNKDTIGLPFVCIYLTERLGDWLRVSMALSCRLSRLGHAMVGKTKSGQFLWNLLLTWCILLTCPSMDRSSREERVVPSCPGMSTQTKCRFFGRN